MSDGQDRNTLYTTGEVAKLSGVSVRTVQYYDSREILTPSALSEGGRRLYSEEDLEKLRAICFLRDVGLSINSIGDLLRDEAPESVIEILLDRQEAILRDELKERQNKLLLIGDVRKQMQQIDGFSVKALRNIAHILENKKRLRRVRAIVFLIAILAELLETGVFLWGIATGNWWPYLAVMPLLLLIVLWVSFFYLRRVEYVCPKCNTIFKPRLKESFFAYHTLNMRKLTCISCGHKGLCVEIYRKEQK